jgi:ABC-type multidrug transport system fused ATPase/permease subunit
VLLKPLVGHRLRLRRHTRLCVRTLYRRTAFLLGEVLPDHHRQQLGVRIIDREAAAREVGADRFITQLPDGYDEKVAERGSRLSIGQRQLIAFARALLVDPRLLILDEATSSVDIQTEAHIEEALARLLANRTAFVVAHRLSTIRNADLIVVLEHGKVVEAGSHEVLLELGGRYRGLYGDWAEAAAR